MGMVVFPAILVLLAANVAMAQSTTQPSDAIPESLNGRRILIVIAEVGDDPKLLKQRESIKADAAGFSERDVAIVEVFDGIGKMDGRPMTPGQRDAVVRLASIPSSFGVALVGRDGGVKMRSSEAVPAKAIFDLIDSMPMRQREIRDKT